jgi:hypothetical protein
MDASIDMKIAESETKMEGQITSSITQSEITTEGKIDTKIGVVQGEIGTLGSAVARYTSRNGRFNWGIRNRRSWRIRNNN